jgi:hypothetical protein
MTERTQNRVRSADQWEQIDKIRHATHKPDIFLNHVIHYLLTNSSEEVYKVTIFWPSFSKLHLSYHYFYKCQV